MVCLGGIGPLNGNFLLDFSGGNTLFGSAVGAATANATPGMSDVALSYTILGGTGQYLGATGGFNGIGLIDQRISPATPSVTFSFAAVPEPESWAMMLLGFGAAGMSIRRRRSLTVPGRA